MKNKLINLAVKARKKDIFKFCLFKHLQNKDESGKGEIPCSHLLNRNASTRFHTFTLIYHKIVFVRWGPYFNHSLIIQYYFHYDAKIILSFIHLFVYLFILMFFD